MVNCNHCGVELNNSNWFTSSQKKRDYICKQCNTKRVYENSLKCKIEVFTHYSNGTPKCACCGEMLIGFLTIDHIDGDGKKQRIKLKISSGNTFYYWLRRTGYPKGYQVLCFNCNCGRYHNGVCPHKNQNKEWGDK